MEELMTPEKEKFTLTPLGQEVLRVQGLPQNQLGNILISSSSPRFPNTRTMLASLHLSISSTLPGHGSKSLSLAAPGSGLAVPHTVTGALTLRGHSGVGFGTLAFLHRCSVGGPLLCHAQVFVGNPTED